MESAILIFLGLFIAVNAVLAVTTKRILRAATYLLFVLFGAAGIYFQLNYTFLGAVQLMIYAGGVTVLYVFSILLISSKDDIVKSRKGYKMFAGLSASVIGFGLCLYLILKNDFAPAHFTHGETDIQTVGHALVGLGKNGYVLPFEVVSILLLAAIVGGIMIARKR
jgi:NADH-quinone oxidoreductase subunit J